MSKSIFASAITIANSMIGSSMILFPVTFNESGIIINVLFLVKSQQHSVSHGIFHGSHLQITRRSTQQQRKRHHIIDPKKTQPHFRCSFWITLFHHPFSRLISLLSPGCRRLLRCFPRAIRYINFNLGDVSLSEKAFKLIIMGAFALLNYLPDLKIFFKLAPGAMGCLIISTLILIISIAFNTDNISIDFFKVKPLSAKSLLGVASINGFAFICHPSVSPIVQQHKSK